MNKPFIRITIDKAALKTWTIAIVAVQLLALPFLVYAGTYTFGPDFSAGDAIEHTRFNGEFGAIEMAVTDNDSRIGALEAPRHTYASPTVPQAIESAFVNVASIVLPEAGDYKCEYQMTANNSRSVTSTFRMNALISTTPNSTLTGDEHISRATVDAVGDVRGGAETVVLAGFHVFGGMLQNETLYLKAQCVEPGDNVCQVEKAAYLCTRL